MSKTVEEMAREWVVNKYGLDGSKASMGMDLFSAHNMVEAFHAGQKVLLDEASEGFSEWWREFVKADLGLNVSCIPDHKIEKAWQASALSHLAKIAALEQSNAALRLSKESLANLNDSQAKRIRELEACVLDLEVAVNESLGYHSHTEQCNSNDSWAKKCSCGADRSHSKVKVLVHSHSKIIEDLIKSIKPRGEK